MAAAEGQESQLPRVPLAELQGAGCSFAEDDDGYDFDEDDGVV